MKKYEMIRKKQELSIQKCEEILDKRTAGVLGVITEEGYPYTVPVNYIYADNKIYFHGLNKGLKISCLRNNNKVSFCVIDKDDVINEELTTYFRSVIVFGTVDIIEGTEKTKEIAREIGLKFLEDIDKINLTIENEMPVLACFQINIEYITGKQASELVGKE